MLSDSGTEILLIEDNAGDAELMREAFDELATPVRLHCVRDGEQGLAALRAAAAGTLPALVILDLNLPLLSGRELLEEIRADAALRTLTVLVLTTSSAPSDRAACYALGCNAYLTKPVGYLAILKLVQAIDAFWLHCAHLPGGEA